MATYLVNKAANFKCDGTGLLTDASDDWWSLVLDPGPRGVPTIGFTGAGVVPGPDDPKDAFHWEAFFPDHPSELRGELWEEMEVGHGGCKVVVRSKMFVGVSF